MRMTREEALKAITAFVENYACGSDLDGLREAIEALKEQRPHGEWIFKHNSSDIWCSNCDENFNEIPQKFLFCPNCGADMREGDEK